jgi:uncharacterized membrane protein
MASETARVEAFSDGVYAIAITLLILDLKVPTTHDGHLALALLRQWPTYFAYLVSFAFIGIMWVNHHRLFTHIRRSDNRLLFFNLLLLLGVSVVPFPTALLAANLGGPDVRTAATVFNGADARTAAAVFNGTYVLIAIFFNVLWHHAVNASLLEVSVQESANAISRQYAVGPIAYLVCLALTWVSVPLSLALNIALAVFFALPARKTG